MKAWRFILFGWEIFRIEVAEVVLVDDDEPEWPGGPTGAEGEHPIFQGGMTLPENFVGDIG